MVEYEGETLAVADGMLKKSQRPLIPVSWFRITARRPFQGPAPAIQRSRATTDRASSPCSARGRSRSARPAASVAAAVDEPLRATCEHHLIELRPEDRGGVPLHRCEAGGCDDLRQALLGQLETQEGRDSSHLRWGLSGSLQEVLHQTENRPVRRLRMPRGKQVGISYQQGVLTAYLCIARWRFFVGV